MKEILKKLLLIGAVSCIIGLSFLIIQEINHGSIEEIRKANSFKKECLDYSDKCIAVIDELMDRHANDSTFDIFYDSLKANGYYEYHYKLDSLYSKQL